MFCPITEYSHQFFRSYYLEKTSTKSMHLQYNPWLNRVNKRYKNHKKVILTSCSPVKTSKREMRLWPSLRSSNKSRICRFACKQTNEKLNNAQLNFYIVLLLFYWLNKILCYGTQKRISGWMFKENKTENKTHTLHIYYELTDGGQHGELLTFTHTCRHVYVWNQWKSPVTTKSLYNVTNVTLYSKTQNSVCTYTWKFKDLCIESKKDKYEFFFKKYVSNRQIAVFGLPSHTKKPEKSLWPSATYK